MPGVRVTEIPESRINVAEPDFLVSSTEVAVIRTRRFGNLVGSGTLLGAVYVTVVLVEFAGIFPVSEVQGSAVAVVGLPVESTVVVVYVQVQVTLRSVAPLTKEVNVMDWDTIIVAEEGLTPTVTTLVLLPPPQPAIANAKIMLRLNHSLK